MAEQAVDSLQKCPARADAVIKDIKLLARPADWRIGPDGKYHWRSDAKDRAVCGSETLMEAR